MPYKFSKGVLTKVNNEPPDKEEKDEKAEKSQPKKKEEARGSDKASS